MVYGRTGSARGCGKAASENCGTNKAYPELLTMYYTGRATTCRTLTIERGSSTRRYRVTVLMTSYHCDSSGGSLTRRYRVTVLTSDHCDSWRGSSTRRS